MKNILIFTILFLTALSACGVHALEFSDVNNTINNTINNAQLNISQERSKGFDTSGAESLLLEAKQAFKDRDYSKSYILARQADAVSLDIDKDGIQNGGDFAPSVNNSNIFYIYIIFLAIFAIILKIYLKNRQHIRNMKQEVLDMIDEIVSIKEEKAAQSSWDELISKKSFQALLLLGFVLVGYVAIAPVLNDTSGNFGQIYIFNLTNSIGMDFVLIPAGEFDMGSPSNEAERYDGEGPVHRVKIGNAFYMGKYEVTQKQWRDVMGTDPSRFKGDNLPVESVSWNDAQDFIKKLNEKEGGNKYRLPTEAEWEYAARVGTTTRYSFGDDESKPGDHAWYYANSGSKTHEVGRKEPNPWGLYDMHGNVWEWVRDRWHDSYDGAPTDGSSWESGGGSSRVDRGGGWGSGAGSCRSAVRDLVVPGLRGVIVGFRLLRGS